MSRSIPILREIRGRAVRVFRRGPEAANNASAAGTLVPMLSLGLPTNATAAGAFAVDIQPFDLALLLIFGLLGLMMRRFGLSVLPLIIGVILGPRIERLLRQSLKLGRGDWGSLFNEPVAIAVYFCMALLLLAPLVKLMHRSEETLLIVEDEHDQREHDQREGPSVIVVGYTNDRFGRAALEHGIAEAKLRQTALLILNSTQGDSFVEAAFAHEREVHDLEAMLADCGVPFEVEQPSGVYAADALLAMMDRADAELLVIGIRHRNPVGKLLLGSVSQQLLLECQKPVLAVKPAM